MTLRKIALFAVGLPLLAGFFACNSTYEPTVMTASSAAVKTFSLTKDDSVLSHLDSVYFSIDLNKGLIFNADSLPYGTNVSRLIPVITTLERASAVELRVKRANGTDTVYDYLNNSTDSIDFTGPVNLKVVSYDGLNEFNYTITVNVHKMVSDSLTWDENNKSTLPSPYVYPADQRTAFSNGRYYCFTASQGKYSLATYSPVQTPTNSPLMGLDQWKIGDTSFPFTPRLRTLSSTDEALFILADDGTLYRSDDGASSWQPTAFKWHYIYGEYDGQLLGSVETADGWMVQSYPSGRLTPVPAGMPVEGSSMPVSYSFSMSATPQLVIVGGRTAAGKLTSATWSFDGSSWVAISKQSLPTPLEDVALAMYFSFKTSSSWNAYKLPTLIAFGGRDESGAINPTMYISTDYGVNWSKASSLMQFPAYIPAMYGSQAFVADSYYSASLQPKIAKPTETWACPYIYLFGGYNAQGLLYNSLWRGVINRLSFAPVE